MRRLVILAPTILMLAACGTATDNSSDTGDPDKHVVECLKIYPGASKWSDGTVSHSDYCEQFGDGPVYAPDPEAESTDEAAEKTVTQEITIAPAQPQ